MNVQGALAGDRHATRRAARFTGAVLAGFLALASVAAAQDQATPQTQEIGLLFVQTAPKGSLERVGDERRYALTLRGVRPEVVWFSDRPERQQGQIRIRDFIRSWRGFGFAADPPNAALTLLRGDDGEDTVILALGRPRYDAARSTLRYPTRKLPQASGNLSGFAPDRDRRVPRRFEHASLFIDDASAAVSGGCVFQPHANCSNKFLVGVNVAGLDLTGIDFVDTNLEDSDFDGTRMPGANFSGSRFIESTVRNANVAGATIVNAFVTNNDFTGANLEQANLSASEFGASKLIGANLEGADLTETDLRNADLTGADLTGADLTGAVFCKTTMPNGTVNNSGC